MIKEGNIYVPIHQKNACLSFGSAADGLCGHVLYAGQTAAGNDGKHGSRNLRIRGKTERARGKRLCGTLGSRAATGNEAFFGI